MTKDWLIRLSGTGGQGIVTAAVILAEAALIDGNNATQTQVYGPESRGSSTRAEVIISDKKIYYHKVETPNLLLIISQEAYRKYEENISPGGIMILDSNIGVGDKHKGIEVYRAPITLIARDQVGNALCANAVALGVLNAVAKCCSDEAFEESLRRNFKPFIVDVNVRAFKAGLQAEITKDAPGKKR